MCRHLKLDPFWLNEDELCKIAALFTLGHSVNGIAPFFPAVQKLWHETGVGQLPRSFKFYANGSVRITSPP